MCSGQARRQDIARNIAKELLENDVLDLQNFSYDTEAVLKHVQDTILDHLKDYSNISRYNILTVGNNRYIEPYQGCLAVSRCPSFISHKMRSRHPPTLGNGSLNAITQDFHLFSPYH